MIRDFNAEELNAARVELQQKGYYAFDSFFNAETIDAILQEVESVNTRSIGDANVGIVRNANGYPIVMNQLSNQSDYLFDLARHPSLVSVAQHLLTKRSVPLHIEYFAKPAGDTSTPTPTHQDQVFYQYDFPNEIAISLWIALDDVTSKSGALEYGSPLPAQLLPHVTSNTADFALEMLDVGASTFSAVPLKRGGCVIHTSYVVHRTGPNSTDHQRRALVLNYRGSTIRSTMLPIEELDFGKEGGDVVS